MKKLNLLYALLFAVAIVACKDDDESPSFKKEDFFATWKEDGTEDGDCFDVIKLDATKWYEGTKCGTADADFDGGTTYTYDNKSAFIISFFGLEAKYVVTSKTATTFKVDEYF